MFLACQLTLLALHMHTVFLLVEGTVAYTIALEYFKLIGLIHYVLF